jgi:FkbM family methyltransferase
LTQPEPASRIDARRATFQERDMGVARNLIKRTFLYGLIQRYRAKRALTAWSARDQAALEFYSQFVPRGSLCFDVGANIGNRSKVFLRLGAKVVAVEPQPDCVQLLRVACGNDRRLTVVQKALGEAPGEATMMVNTVSSISSMSPDWIRAVRESHRFDEGQQWAMERTVPITTLDALIAQHGKPAFLKIDVEGYEYEVIKGLTQPVHALSLEFTPEMIESTFRCIEHLERLGDIRLNYATGETMRLSLPEWVDSAEMVRILGGFRGDNALFGDVYVRFE